MGTFVSGSGGVGGDNIVTFTVGANDCSAFSVNGVFNDFVPGPVDTLMTGSFMSSLFTAEHEPIEIQLPDQTERYRVTAMGCKITFFGSTLNNEGEIAGALTYPGWTPYGGQSAWDEIAQLPFQSYDGRLETGFHGFWVPTDVSELDFPEVGPEFSSGQYTRLWAAIKGADPTASIRVELDMIVEFYSPLPYFSKSPTPYFSDYCGRLMHSLGLQTCVGDNPGHLARLGNICKTVAKTVKTAGEVAAMVL